MSPLSLVELESYVAAALGDDGLVPGQFVTIASLGSEALRYVQFARLDDCVYAEVVGDGYLEDWEQLLPRDYLVLDVLGWNPPGTDGCPIEAHGNFFQTWPLHVAADEVVETLLRTVVATCMAGEIGLFEVTRGSWEKDEAA